MYEKISQNWKSGLTVAFVAMPLSISLAVASNATPTMGIITAIWAGLVAALFGGSNYNVVGPTGALSGLIASYVLLHGMLSLPALTIVAGVLILIGYFLRVERYLVFIHSAVISGFTLGVAFIIGFNQMNYALGLHDVPKHESFFANIAESFRHIDAASPTAFLVFAIFLALLFLCKKFLPRIPGALILSPIGIVLGALTLHGVVPLSLDTLGSTFADITFRAYIIPTTFTLNGSLFSAAIAIAFIAILETMLSAKIADGATNTKYNERKEILGLGFANLASGFAGGIPATAALARTSLNIKSGATDKTSSALSAVFLCMISFFFLSFFQFIPMTVIAAILVYVAIQMVEFDHLKKFYAHERSAFWISLLVAAITFFEDPIMGILFGIAASLLVFVEKISRGQFEISLNTKKDGLIKTISGEVFTGAEDADVVIYSMSGKLSYLNSRPHINRFLNELSKYPVIVIRLRGINYMDVDGANAIEEILANKRGGQIIALSGASLTVIDLLSTLSPHFKEIQRSGFVFGKSEEALHFFGVKTEKHT